MALLDFLRRLFGQPASSDARKPPAAASDPVKAEPPPARPAAAAAPASPARPTPGTRPQTLPRPQTATVVPPKASQVVRPVDGVPPPPAPGTRGNVRTPLQQQTRAAPPVQPDVLSPAPPVTPPPPPVVIAPVKALHRRLQLVDARLVAKTSGGQHVTSARRRSKRAIAPDESARLFSTTLRTRNRAARLLAIDEAQLARYGLPVWRTEADVAQALDVPLKTLRHFSMHSAQERTPHYVTFAIPKRSGGERLIMAPKRRLKALQRRLNTLLCAKLPASEHAHGFRSGHSVRTNAQPHVGKRVLLQLDLHEFFPSIHFGRVRGLLLALGYGYPVASVLAALMTEAPRQPVAVDETVYFAPVGPRVCPQGAPTSPHLSNALLLKMDRRLAGLARRMRFSYTRYADDLTFSGDDIANAHALRILAGRIVEDEGFRVNPEKTRILREGARQSVTGVVVNDVLGLSRQARRRLRAAIHRCAQAQAAGTPLDPARLARLEGELAYLAMLNPQQAQRLAGN
jgi:RNA-directed DNA polymerase